MKQLRKVAVASAMVVMFVVMLAVAACGNASAPKNLPTNSPQFRQAEQITLNCVKKYPANGKALVHCVAPGGKASELRLEHCLIKAVSGSGLTNIRRVTRSRLVHVVVPNCILASR